MADGVRIKPFDGNMDFSMWKVKMKAIDESYLYDSSIQLISSIATLYYANSYFLVWFCISGVSEALGGNAHKR
ncbi:unnamed protein product [Rhodiola kirilowii]